MSNILDQNISYLIECMERKNLCLRSFHQLCGEFLDQIAKNNIEVLDDFQRKRNSLIKVMTNLENDINSGLTRLAEQKKTMCVEEKIASLLTEKEARIRSILDLDNQIINHIHRLKGETIQKLQSVQMGKKTITAYKSPLEQIEASENANKTLDKKA